MGQLENLTQQLSQSTEVSLFQSLHRKVTTLQNQVNNDLIPKIMRAEQNPYYIASYDEIQQRISLLENNLDNLRQNSSVGAQREGN